MKNIKFTTLWIGMLTIAIASSCGGPKSSMNNMVALMQVTEPIEGVCDNSKIYAIFPLPGNGQVSAKAPKSDAELNIELNEKVTFLKDKPDYEDSGMVGLIINCKGELVKCDIDNKTKSPELDAQIVAVFATMKTWTAGTVNKVNVDTSELYSFTIKNGKITLN